MAIALTMLFIVCPLAALFFIVRLACAAFSSKVFDEMRSHPVFHGIWACFALVGVLLFLGVLNRWAWPPPFVERRGQRQQVLQRVQSAGGWVARTASRGLTAAPPLGHGFATASARRIR